MNEVLDERNGIIFRHCRKDDINSVKEINEKTQPIGAKLLERIASNLILKIKY